jgi:hypothetical protein
MIVSMRFSLGTLALAGAMQTMAATGGAAPATGMRGSTPAVVRNGQQDFDFLVGRWKLQNRRLKRPLSGSNEWYEFAGTSEARTLWGGRVLLEVVRFDIPNHPIDGLSLHYYDARTGRWSQYWSTASNGLDTIPNVGSFNDHGVGVLTDHETFAGRPIMSRYRWTHTVNSARWEQAFSQDGGKTWETNWTTDYARLP